MNTANKYAVISVCESGHCMLCDILWGFYAIKDLKSWCGKYLRHDSVANVCKGMQVCIYTLAPTEASHFSQMERI